VYVSNAGKRHDVTVFGADGKFRRAIGKPGGRAMTTPPPAVALREGSLSPARAGKWDPDTLLAPRGLAVDAKGRLWVMEHDFSPKRISVWDPVTGKLLDEKFGPCYVSTPACMDPADPTRVYCQNVEWEVDLEKGTWKPAAVMFEARPDTPYFWPHGVNNMVFTAKNGKQYMTSGGGSGLVRGHFLWVRRGDHFEAAAGVISPWAGLTWRKAPKDWQEANKMPWLWWEDRNGDGAIQQAETRETKVQAQNPHCVVDADLNFYATGMYNHLYWQRISPKQVLPSGVPLYDDASLLHVDYAKEGPNYTYDLAVNPADGGVFLYAGADIKYLDKTELWPITYWTREGRLVWRYRPGCRWHDMYEFPIPKPGELYGCTRNLGITDGITGFSCYFGQAQLMTTDGVVIGTIMKDGRVLEVTGLDTIRRLEGKLTLTPDEAKASAAALRRAVLPSRVGRSGAAGDAAAVPQLRRRAGRVPQRLPGARQPAGPALAGQGRTAEFLDEGRGSALGRLGIGRRAGAVSSWARLDPAGRCDRRCRGVGRRRVGRDVPSPRRARQPGAGAHRTDLKAVRRRGHAEPPVRPRRNLAPRVGPGALQPGTRRLRARRAAGSRRSPARRDTGPAGTRVCAADEDHQSRPHGADGHGHARHRAERPRGLHARRTARSGPRAGQVGRTARAGAGRLGRRALSGLPHAERSEGPAAAPSGDGDD
jgi:hypothetical protein